MEEGKSRLRIERHFSKKGSIPINYVKSDVQITDENNKPLFVQKDVEFPDYFSQLSKQITSSRYFYGGHETPERENSFKEVVEGIAETYEKWSLKQRYFNKKYAEIFKDELINLFLTQRVAPNSPVWFNVRTYKFESRKTNEKKDGYCINDRTRNIEVLDELGGTLEIRARKGDIIPIQKGEYHLYPQTSACFIQGVEDTMESISQLGVNEARIFKHGSGTGSDLSSLRSSKEKLSGGGKPSGPLAYLVFYDKKAGIVKSGGKTRRAAKMDSLRIDHPDIKEFIEAKGIEERKISALINEGIPQKEAVESVHYQNTNVSVRVTDEFMRAVEEDKDWQTIPVHSKELADKMPKYKARDLLRMIAKATHECGDPGVQYHDTINKWHTCKNSGPIRASNPCSEYMFVDDSSCNLASLNLMSFVNENGKFKVNDFEKAIKTIVISMELNYDNSIFPTKKIAENSYKFRPLGLGYANLGGLLMAMAVPYDSDEARDIAASITSLMTSTVYEESIEMAKELGPFKGYSKNKEPMLNIIKMHVDYSKQLTNKIKSSNKKTDFNLEEIASRGDTKWDHDLKEGSRYGFRNSQATVLAPTGTIGFIMDCYTKGIESELGLVQTKLLAEGGKLRMINGTVPLALKKLGYNDEQIKIAAQYVAGHGLDEKTPHLKKEHYKKFEESKNKLENLKELGYSTEQVKDIMTYVEGHETMEGCPIIKPEHLAVFDCANKPNWAKRAISYQGHIKMMAAVQPFLSGAISKTVNLPKEASVEEIENVYKEAWKMGLKAVALYRDGSKARQPMSFSKKFLEEKVEGPVRKKLPVSAKAMRHKFCVAGHEGYLHVGLYENNTPGELFINMSKEGSTIGGLMDCFATSISMNLQYGVPLKTLVNKFKGQRFDPAGYVNEGHPDIVETDAKSLIDYIFNFMGKTFLEEEKNEETKPKKAEIKSGASSNIPATTTGDKDYNKDGYEYAGFCPCGARLIKSGGHCMEVCEENCGFVNYNGCAG